jgi:hypothetical protein
MNFIPSEVKKLEKDMYTNYQLIQKEVDDLTQVSKEKEIKQINPSQLYKYIGTQKVMKTSDFSRISAKAVPFLEELLGEERDEHYRKLDNKESVKSTHLKIRDIHNYHAVNTKNKVFILFYILPAIFVFKASKLKSLSVWRFFFMIPLITAYPTINDGIKQYTSRKQAILMLFCLEKNYKHNSNFYSKYCKFMKDHSLEFKEVHLIEPVNNIQNKV